MRTAHVTTGSFPTIHPGDPDYKLVARILTIHLGPDEWGNEMMERVAREAFQADHTLDVVEVYEHAGWHLSYLRSGVICATANDRAELRAEAYEFFRYVSSYEYAGSIRRP